MKLTQEMMEKSRAAKSADELLEIAKANGVELTADEAKTYFEQISSCQLDEDLLKCYFMNKNRLLCQKDIRGG